MLNPNFVFIGVGLQLIGSWSYLRDTIKGRIKPNKVSWLLWTIAPMIAFFAEIKQGVGVQSLVTFSVGFVPAVIFVASFLNKKATWDLGKLDIVCGVLSVIGLILWLVTKVGNVAIFFAIVADGLAAVPTIVKSYKYPETENATIFAVGIINALLGVLVISTWNFQHYGFPIYLLLVDGTIAFLILSKIGNRMERKV